MLPSVRKYLTFQFLVILLMTEKATTQSYSEVTF